MALDRRTAAAGEETEAFVESRRDLGRPERDDPRRRELDGERDAVESTADLGDRGVVRVDGRVRSHRPCPLVEQLHGLVVDERAERPHLLPSDGESFAARGQDPRRLRSAEHAVRQVRGGVEEVLAVVEHEQQLLGP